MKKLLSLLLVFGGSLAYAQTVDDVELFQNRNLHGSPRFTAMGGAFSALGNNPSSYTLNPAGAAVNRHSNLSFSLGFNDYAGDYSNFYNTNGFQRNFNVLFENVGLNLMLNKDGEDRFSLAFSTTKLADFNRNFNIDGLNNEYTLGEYWADRWQNVNTDFISDDAFAAWDAYLLVSDSTGAILPDGFAYGDLDNNNQLVANSTMRYTMNQDGSMNETNIVLALDKGHKWYYGLSFGIPTVNFRREEFITEYNLPNSNPPYSANEYTYRRLNDIYGAGFNMKLGFIYNPIDEIRIAASYQSPSWYTINQNYEVDVTTSFNQEPEPGVGTFVEGSTIATGQYSYRLRTPAIYRAGLASVIGKFLILSVDYQYQSQDNQRLYTNNNSFGIDESFLQTEYQPDLDNMYRSARHTLAAGLEVKLSKFFIRGGYRQDESVYKEEFVDNTAGGLQAYSGGFGYNSGPWSFDISYIHSVRDRSYALYRGVDANNEAFEVLDDLDMREVTTNIVAGISVKF